MSRPLFADPGDRFRVPAPGIEALCDAFAIDRSIERQRELQALDAAGLEGLMAKLRAGRR